MDRREFLEAIAGISALVPGLALLPALEPEAFARAMHARASAATALRTLNPQQDAVVSCIAELLLPATDTPGATAVGVNRFIDLLLTESMVEADRDRFLEGLAAIDARSQSLYGAPVAAARREDQESLIRALDSHLPARAPTPAEKAALEQQPVTAERGFALLKRLAVFAYFTAEPVARDLIHAPIIPGRYDGCVPV
jgi:glucoside 3-dehydrogenase (cytochrome c) hitch-hiker subunit